MTSAVLLPYQQHWIADTSQVKICEKSRRVGLSWAEAANSALEAAKQGGQDTWYLGYSQDMAQEFIRDAAWWTGHYQIAADAMEQIVVEDEDRDILAYRINFASGNRITALSSSPRNLRGKQGRVVIDEAAFHPDLGELLKSAFALLIWGGSVSIISTHFGVDNPFNEAVNDVREGRKPYSLHRITFDDAIEQGLCKRVFVASKRNWSQEAQAAWVESIRAIYRDNAAEELDCVPSNSSGVYLSRALIESRMTADAPVLRYTCKNGFEQLPDHVREADAQDWLDTHIAPLLEALPRTARSSLGQDFGRSGDLSVLVPLLEGQGLQRDCPFVIEMRNTPFRQQEQIVFWLCDRLPRFTHGAFDARGNGQFLAEVAMQRYGSTSITQVMITQNWYLENMPKMKAALEDGTLASMPKDRDILDDLRAIQVIKGIPRIPEGKTKTGQGQQRHGDAAVAFCMAWFATNQCGGAIEYIEVPHGGYATAHTAPVNFMRPAPDRDLPKTDRRGDW
jgi:phage FluMu gp28-like protein